MPEVVSILYWLANMVVCVISGLAMMNEDFKREAVVKTGTMAAIALGILYGMRELYRNLFTIFLIALVIFVEMRFGPIQWFSHQLDHYVSLDNMTLAVGKWMLGHLNDMTDIFKEEPPPPKAWWQT